MMTHDDVEGGNLGHYQDRPRTFPNMRSKPYTPVVSNNVSLACLDSLLINI